MTLIKYATNSQWGTWKKNSGKYMNKDWSPIRYAFLFKFGQGSLPEYSLKNERLVLEMNK